jgi:phenylacetic acid degradation operon negative regulatory protein
MDEWRTMPSLDPELPTELLPARWPRAAARAVFVELYDGLTGLAEQRVVQVVSGYDPDLAALVRTHTSRTGDT